MQRIDSITPGKRFEKVLNNKAKLDKKLEGLELQAYRIREKKARKSKPKEPIDFKKK